MSQFIGNGAEFVARAPLPRSYSRDVVRFSTAGLPDSRRVELWEGHNARTLVGLDCHTLIDFSLEATELNLQLPRVQFAHVSGTAHVVERTQRNIDTTPADSVVVYFNLHGDAFFYHKNGCEMLRPGQAILYDADQPFMRGFAHGLREVALKIPRAIYKELSGGNSQGQLKVFDFHASPAANSHANALAGLMKDAFTTPSEDREHLEMAALDLFRVLLQGNSDGGLGHFTAARSFILQRLRDPQLSAVQVAAAIGISDRHLSRIFALHGMSVARFILTERLKAARQALTQQDTRRRTVGELAAGLGFSSHAHFSRAYKEHFGVGPLQDRRAAEGLVP
ncbi:helix-turn-helix domain-containing protein [Arthrobacter sp. zg-ZUI100]|uniref:helix-turn-helix domain-containing protein n=1 Tax=Arthrobacter jiangjiafuii TaxID=2817475 RepID=UPI001AEE4274|nr:helix-turn-helix domain-containing protein [Arthrobacter jiangjiafuii]MBP3035902.1 helix-turn-helix domain-containing protein [Arthrobacter jiangjiafuii]